MDQGIKERLAILDPEYRTLIKSGLVQESAVTFAEAENFTTDQKNILENAYTLYLLFFLDKNQAVDFVASECEVTRDRAEDLVFGFIATLPEWYQSAHAVAYHTLTQSADEQPAPTQPVPPPTQPPTPPASPQQPAPAPTAPIPQPPSAESTSINQFRTMAEDMKSQSEPTQPATSQDDLLKRS